MWPNGNGERRRMDAVRQMAKSKGENWGEVERAQLQLGKARAAWEKCQEGGSPPAGLRK